MKNNYEKPIADFISFEDNIIITSHGSTKNPGNHAGCSIMPNGKPIPGGARGYPNN